MLRTRLPQSRIKGGSWVYQLKGASSPCLRLSSVLPGNASAPRKPNNDGAFLRFVTLCTRKQMESEAVAFCALAVSLWASPHECARA